MMVLKCHVVCKTYSQGVSLCDHETLYIDGVLNVVETSFELTNGIREWFLLSLTHGLDYNALDYNELMQ